jgi:hypothetical protein
VDPIVKAILHTPRITVPDIYNIYLLSLGLAVALICVDLGLKTGIAFAFHSLGRVCRNFVLLKWARHLIGNCSPKTERYAVSKAPYKFEAIVSEIFRSAKIRVKTAVFTTSSPTAEIRTIVNENRDEVSFYLTARLLTVLTEEELRSLIARECGLLLHGVGSTIIHVNAILGSAFSGALDGGKMHCDAATEIAKMSQVRIFRSQLEERLRKLWLPKTVVKMTYSRLALMSDIGKGLQIWSFFSTILGRKTCHSFTLPVFQSVIITFNFIF